jgi:SAM-dependent methyltransferase
VIEQETENNTTDTLAAWLQGFREESGLRYLSSARSFGKDAAGEEAYASQFSVDADYLRRVGSGIRHVLSTAASDCGHGALEIGCGTGIFTAALLASTDYPRYYISDMSPAFVNRTRSLVSDTAAAKRVEYLVLSSEAFDAWPEGTLSLVALRYVLHHVLDWRAFIAHAARLLVPGGVLLLEEPCADGYLLQAMLMKSLRNRVDDLGCSDDTRKQIDFFISTIFWYLQTDADKTASEDKHVFQPASLLALGDEVGLRGRFHQNLGFDGIGPGQVPSSTYFVDEFRHNLKVNFGVNPETLELFETQIVPLCEPLQLVSGATNGPVIKGVFSFTKKP